jgi:hypothetical protein
MTEPVARIGLGGWLQAIANFAILAGLILVALQIRQATTIAEAQFVSDLMDSSARAFEAMAGESLPGAWSRAMSNAHRLSDEDLAVIDAFLTREWMNGVRYAAVAERGYGPGSTTSGTVEKWAVAYLGNETAMRWWQAAARKGMLDMNPLLRDRVNERLEALGPTHAAYHADLLDALRGSDSVGTQVASAGELAAATGGNARATGLEAEAESLIRAQYAAWNAGDLKAILETNGHGFTTGFGFRTLAPRGDEAFSDTAVAQAVEAFLASVAYYRLSIDELHTRAFGNVLVAWGFHTEDFQVRGRAPEIVRVRFSATLMKTPGGWRGLIGHRDAQPFDEHGQYLPAVAAR